MKFIQLLFFIFVALSTLLVTQVFADEECGSNADYHTTGYACKFSCTPDGVVVDCNAPGCRCQNPDFYFNTDTKTCNEVNCENLECQGKENEQFFTSCQSGSRDKCGCSRRLTFDCQRGCMCKNGFCRQDGICVRRDCEHPVFKETEV